MNENSSLFFVIVECGKGNKIFKQAKKAGAKNGTFFLGKGTVKSHLLDVLAINEVKKEILMMVVDQEIEDLIYEGLDKKFNLNKPNHGIAFSMPLNHTIRTTDPDIELKVREHEVSEMKYEAIFTIVNKGLSEEVIGAAEKAGSTGGTVIHGRGANSAEKETLFNITIEPEKEIILILSHKEKTDEIIKAIKKDLNILDRGAGIIFTLDVNKTCGLFKGDE